MDPEELGNANEPVEIPERPVTASSWKTSASQKQYIEMLENMLKEERMKRVAIQARMEDAVPFSRK